MMNYLTKAIQRLKPTAEFSFTENDYSTIKWDVLDGKAPTKAEIEAAIELVKADEAKAEAAKQTAKETAQAKLAALGLTTDDLKALGL
jgi:TfoX/Sxy family transcriptional regulator of competence genes